MAMTVCFSFVLCGIHCEICSIAQPNFANDSLLKMKDFKKYSYRKIQLQNIYSSHHKKMYICVHTQGCVTGIDDYFFPELLNSGNFETLALFLSLTVLSIPL